MLGVFITGWGFHENRCLVAGTSRDDVPFAVHARNRTTVTLIGCAMLSPMLDNVCAIVMARRCTLLVGGNVLSPGKCTEGPKIQLQCNGCGNYVYVSPSLSLSFHIFTKKRWQTVNNSTLYKLKERSNLKKTSQWSSLMQLYNRLFFWQWHFL